MKKTKRTLLPKPTTETPAVVVPEQTNGADFQDKKALKMPSPRSDLYRDHL